MVRPSSVIVCYRRAPEFEIFWSLRQPELPFLGGFYAFFGGSVEAEDADLPGAQGDAFLACAARELLEEAGIWVVDGGATLVDPAHRHASAFGQHLREHGMTVAAERFAYVGYFVTPEFSPIRYETRFYAVDLTGFEHADMLTAHLDEGELEHGEWLTPEEALARWRSGDAFVSQPVRFMIQALRNGPDTFADVAAFPSVRDHAHMAPGIFVVPLRSPTIPPATHTNCILVGDGDFVVVDPGGDDAEEVARLCEVIDEHVAHGGALKAIVLTHHHPDHVAAVEALQHRYNVGVWAHPRTGARLGWSLERELHDGDVVDLGIDRLDVIYTPGHADGHLAFHHERTGICMVGDLVAQKGTILVDPEDGHMGDYLDSLETIAELKPRAVLPAHGWLIPQPLPLLRHYQSHRLAREDKVRRALGELRKATAEEVTPLAYADTPKEVWPIAVRSALSHLIHLTELGEAFRHGDVFEMRAARDF